MVALVWGMIEFRSDFTRHFDDERAYDLGRDLMHRLTFRYFDA